MQFEYFEGPEADMSDYSGLAECSLCGRRGPTFSLEFTICPELPTDGRTGRTGCANCLSQGRFEFWHDTEIGLLDERGLTKVYSHNQDAPPTFRTAALAALKRTPQIATWQQEIWLTHCDDFMVYTGTWEPRDFYAHASDGDGRALFLRMTAAYPELWDESADGSQRLETWHATYYAFRCRHCGTLRGNWDCD